MQMWNSGEKKQLISPMYYRKYMEVQGDTFPDPTLGS